MPDHPPPWPSLAPANHVVPAATGRRAPSSCDSSIAHSVHRSARAREALAPPPSRPRTAVTAVGTPQLRRTLGSPLLMATILRDAPSRRFVRFERRPVMTRARLSPFWRSVAATSCTFFRRSDRWIGDFFTLSQSRFVGPTSSACISSTAALFGVLPVPVRSWTLWLQWDLPFTYQLFRLSRRVHSLIISYPA
ncbi:putative pollen-specific leucine-rich repeat extensin-like protein 3 [Iris pallida]|uniref:Pollen-specific leucine-rich repeat extensin-like protein 3 n=1 Tax=Iris pallida TaxID=29817 RepID=A0AAX6HL49_IRIPA|nr:putative pollen-specific leucine-rich repeat extensin-like protein 3 [Iris pallida]